MVDPLDAAAESTRLDNIHRILDAAERLFRHYGYAKTNVADIARDLGMSPANIYRFFSSKADIHQAIAQRMLDAGHDAALAISRLPLSAEERLRQYGLQLNRMTVETMLDEEKVHEMVVVALDQQWPVIESHISRLDGVVASIIRDGIAAGEFEDQDADLAARCFGACMVTLCHPQMVAQCLQKPNRAKADELIEFALRSLRKNR